LRKYNDSQVAAAGAAAVAAADAYIFMVLPVSNRY
jgi:hypothetical protein